MHQSWKKDLTLVYNCAKVGARHQLKNSRWLTTGAPAPISHKRLPQLQEIHAELNGAHLKIVVDLLLAPPRQKSGKVKLFLRFFSAECFTWNIVNANGSHLHMRMVLVWPEVPPQFSGGEISSMSRVFFAQLNARNYEREILGLELAFYIFSFWINLFHLFVRRAMRVPKSSIRYRHCGDYFLKDSFII